jgi:hypothetical protein
LLCGVLTRCRLAERHYDIATTHRKIKVWQRVVWRFVVLSLATTRRTKAFQISHHKFEIGSCVVDYSVRYINIFLTIALSRHENLSLPKSNITSIFFYEFIILLLVIVNINSIYKHLAKVNE